MTKRTFILIQGISGILPIRGTHLSLLFSFNLRLLQYHSFEQGPRMSFASLGYTKPEKLKEKNICVIKKKEKKIGSGKGTTF